MTDTVVADAVFCIFVALVALLIYGKRTKR